MGLIHHNLKSIEELIGENTPEAYRTAHNLTQKLLKMVCDSQSNLSRIDSILHYLRGNIVNLGSSFSTLEQGKTPKGMEGYYKSVLNFGKLFNRNPDFMVVSLMTGHAIQINALSEMETLYSRIDEKEKKRKVSEMLNNIKSERELMLKQLSGKSSR